MHGSSAQYHLVTFTFSTSDLAGLSLTLCALQIYLLAYNVGCVCRREIYKISHLSLRWSVMSQLEWGIEPHYINQTRQNSLSHTVLALCFFIQTLKFLLTRAFHWTLIPPFASTSEVTIVGRYIISAFTPPSG